MATTRPPHYFVVALQILLLLWAASSWSAVQSATTMWCVARSESSQQALQRALDYACGSGADCSPVLSNGLCYLPNTLQAHASYAFNSFYQRKAKAPGACDFSGTATIAASDPSYGSCVYPSSISTAGGASTATPSVPTGTSSTPIIITNTPTIPLLTPPLDSMPEPSGAASGRSSIQSRAFGILTILVVFSSYSELNMNS